MARPTAPIVNAMSHSTPACHDGTRAGPKTATRVTPPIAGHPHRLSPEMHTTPMYTHIAVASWWARNASSTTIAHRAVTPRPYCHGSFTASWARVTRYVAPNATRTAYPRVTTTAPWE